MFRNLLHEITCIGIYQMFSLIVFSGFFLIVAIWLFKTKKEYIDEMKNKPLE